jgi:hypothetical protein
METLGLTLVEGKAILSEIERLIVEAQTAPCVAAHRQCADRGRLPGSSPQSASKSWSFGLMVPLRDVLTSVLAATRQMLWSLRSSRRRQIRRNATQTPLLNWYTEKFPRNISRKSGGGVARPTRWFR